MLPVPKGPDSCVRHVPGHAMALLWGVPMYGLHALRDRSYQETHLTGPS